MTNAKKFIKDDIQQHQLVLDNLKTRISELTTKQSALLKQAKASVNVLKLTDADLENAQKELEVVKVAIQDGKVQIELLTEQQITLELSISEKTTEENRLKSAILVLQDSFKEWNALTDDLEEKYNNATVSKEAEIKLLDAKLLAGRQEIEQYQQEMQTTRISLAERQKQLDERDLNLRIREAKVEQGEDKIIRNSNLLNL